MRTIWSDLRDIISHRCGALALGFLCVSINRLSALVLPYSTRFVIDDVIGAQQPGRLVPIVIVIAGATVIQGLSAFAMAQLVAKTGHRLVFEFRQRVQQHIGILPLSFYQANKVGELVSRIMTDVDGMRNLIGGPMMDFAGAVTTTLVSICVLLVVNPVLALLVAAFVLAFTFVIHRAFAVIRPMQREESRRTADVTGRLTESLGGICVVKSYHAEAREADVFANRLKKLLNTVLSIITTASLMNLSVTLLAGILGAAVWFVGTRSVLAGSMTIGELMTFVAFLGYLITPVTQAVNNGTQLSQALAGLERAQEILREVPEGHNPSRNISVSAIHGKIAFENVCFSYEPGKRVIHDISFNVAPGTITALVGPSGAGKSTVISLLAAFHQPDEGRVLVDEIELSTIQLDSYRTQLGVVLQESFLFDGTVAENVAFSRPSATRAEIMQACGIAHVDEFVETFERKYDTIVGERGVRLSAGQRQRISIARAILADPRILILDEATSSLDSESEQFIQEGLAYLMKNRTTVVIAHRLSTIRQADQILVLERGKIIESGTHDFLCELGGRYWDMYSRQRGLTDNLIHVPGEERWDRERAGA